MKTAPILKTEIDRLKEVLQLEILDTAPELDFDEITALAAEICQVPIALVSIVDSERQWFKSKVGLDLNETSREISFCGHAIWKDEILVVEDATLDDRFKDNPFTTGETPVIFYAGAPLRMPSGQGVGTLCVIDHKPRVLSPGQLRSLQTLSKSVSHLLQLRKQNKSLRAMATEISQKETSLSESAKMAALGQMAAGVAHEINTPLAIISLLANQAHTSAQSSAIDGEKIKSATLKIQSTVDRIARIVRGLLDFSRDGSKDSFAVVQASAVIEDTLAFCADKFRLAGIHLQAHTADGLSLECRTVEISQVLLNLLNNSFDAINEHTLPEQARKIEIDVIDCSDEIEFKVSDTGPGVPEKIRYQIFHPFFSTKEVGKGTGLGLSVSKRIIESHGGSITLNSSNKGAQFVIRLPKSQAFRNQLKISAS